METKQCSGCKIEKGLSNFSKNRSRKDGIQHSCKKCCREYDRKYRQTNGGKEVRRRACQRFDRKRQLLCPEKLKSRHASRYAVKAGKLIRPDHCESCFKECKPEGHHKDYSKPLDVDWLCQECHKKLCRS